MANPPVLTFFSALNETLDATIRLAGSAAQSIVTVSSSLDAAASSIDASLGKLGEVDSDKAAGIKSLAAGIAAAATSIGASTAEVEGHADRMAERLRRSEQETRSVVERLKNHTANAFDDLLQRVEQFTDSISGPTAESLKLAIAEVQDGVLSVEEFARVWGDTMIDVENGKTALRELLKGIDPNEFRRRTQEIRKVNLELADIMTLLTDLHNQAAQGLLELMKLYQQGDITWRRLLESARDVAEAAGKESQTGALAEDLADYLMRNRTARGGRL